METVTLVPQAHKYNPSLEKCECWRQLHNVLETKCTKSGGKSRFPLSFLSPTVNDIRRKPYMVGTYSTVEKQAKRMPDATVETSVAPDSQQVLFR